MVTYDQVIDAYSFLYRKLFLDIRKEYRLKVKKNSRTDEVIKGFVQIVNSHTQLSAGKVWLSIYMCFQFSRWFEYDIKTENRKIYIAFVISKKAFDFFNNRNTSFDWLIGKNIMTKPHDVLVSISDTNEKEGYLLESEESLKKRFINTDDILGLCIEYTTLFNPLSQYCLRCKEIKSCKETQKVNYINIAHERSVW